MSTQSGKLGILAIGPYENRTMRAMTPHSITVFPRFALAILQNTNAYVPETARTPRIGRTIDEVGKGIVRPTESSRFFALAKHRPLSLTVHECKHVSNAFSA